MTTPSMPKTIALLAATILSLAGAYTGWRWYADAPNRACQATDEQVLKDEVMNHLLRLAIDPDKGAGQSLLNVRRCLLCHHMAGPQAYKSQDPGLTVRFGERVKQHAWPQYWGEKKFTLTAALCGVAGAPRVG